MIAPSPESAPVRAVDASGGAASMPARRLLDELRERLRYLHCSLHTEEAFVHWVRAFVRFQGLRHPALSPLDALLPV